MAPQLTTDNPQLYMDPKIEILLEKKLLGKRITMSLSDNKTGELWRNFMPQKNQIKNNVGNQLYSIQIYDSLYFEKFSPHTNFEKWAAIEVTNFDFIPNEMETYILTGGLYAVFLYKGLSTDTKIFEYIYGTWIPNSAYYLDNKPHFEILGEKYKNNDPNSEEEIWIPIKEKNN